ncbi:MAG: sugar ABC transporter substrate-binding protein [Phycisphaerales bacterium]|nr:sugar ABC transporter substrate-binding protein [Phycisphaerales bacterium]
MNGWISKSIWTLLALGLTAWLFADTLRHHFGAAAGANAIRFAYWGGYQDHRIWSEIVAEFNRREPGISIRQEWLPLSGYLTKLDQQFVAGDAPDVVMFQDEPFPRYARQHFVDLAPFIAADADMPQRTADCWPTAIASFRDGESLRGLPVHGGNVLVYCNPDAFARASRFHGRTIAMPDNDWSIEQFVNLCIDLTIDENGDGEPEQFGLLQPHWVYYLPFIWAHGATLLDESRSHWTLTGPAAVESFQLYADLRHRFRVTPTPLEYAGQNSDTAFLSSRVAMCVNGPWYMPFLNDTHLQGRYRVVGIPSGRAPGTTRVTWDALCINSACTKSTQDRAWRFVRFAMSDEAQLIFARSQRAIPARKSMGAKFVDLGGGENSPAAAFIAAMGSARLQPITKHWLPMDSVVRRHLLSVILDGDARRTAEQAVSALANEPIIKQSFGGSR